MQHSFFVNRLSVPMRTEDNEALSDVRAKLEKELSRRLSSAETVRILLKMAREAASSNDKVKEFFQ